MVDLLGHRPEAVAQFGAEGIDRLLIMQVGKAAVKAKADLQVLDIALGDQHRGADVDLRRPLAVALNRVFTRAELGHCLLDHLLIEFVADFLDVSGLLVAQQVTRTAQVEVMARERKACTKRIE